MMPRRLWLIWTAIGLSGAYVASGFYFVRPDERGVVRWFGRVPGAYRQVPPGLHYALPRPFCRVDRPRTTEVRRVYVSLTPEERGAIARGDVQSLIASPASDMLTGDVNVLKATMVVQYQVCDPAQYVFGADQPDELVRNAVEASLIEALAGLPVDQALTTAKSGLQADILRQAQQLLDRYECGVRLVATQFESLDPPHAIVAAFQDVVSAMKDGERAVDRAMAECNRLLARARGEAAQTIEQAEGYRQTRVSHARGDTARFLSVLAEYRKEPEVFRRRLLLQSLESVLPKLRVYVLDQKPGDPPTSVRIIEPTGERAQPAPNP